MTATATAPANAFVFNSEHSIWVTDPPSFYPANSGCVTVRCSCGYAGTTRGDRADSAGIEHVRHPNAHLDPRNQI